MITVELAFHAPAASRLIAEISAERLRELQRFAELGRVSAGLIHDISSPLTAAILHLEQEENRGLHSVRHARRSIRMLERYVESARQQLRQENQTANFWVKGQLRQVKRVVELPASKRQVDLCFAVDKNYSLIGNPIKFQQIMINLINNSIDSYDNQSCRKNKPIVQVTANACCQWLQVQVQDWGSGIASDELLHLFEPFYTTKQTSSIGGLGIGLSIVKRYVEDDFGGKVVVSSIPGDGTVVNIKLRRVSPKSYSC